MNEFQIVEYTRYLNKIRKINENISEQLFGNLIYLLKYSEKYKVKLPKKQELEQLMFNTKPLLESYNLALDEFEKSKKFFKIQDQPTGNTNNFNPEGNSTFKIKH